MRRRRTSALTLSHFLFQKLEILSTNDKFSKIMDELFVNRRKSRNFVIVDNIKASLIMNKKLFALRHFC